MNTLHNIDDILARHFSGEQLSADEQRQLDAYRENHADEYRSMAALLAAYGQEAAPMAVDTQAAWQKVEPRLVADTRRRPWLRRGRWLAAAALVLLVVGLAVLAYNRFGGATATLYANATEADMALRLPDGSQVVLAPASKIEYGVHGDGHRREVALTGKAAFDVSHNGADFVVTAGDVRVEVLGTAFTVDATVPDSTGVSVSHGRVQVSTATSAVVLTRGEQVGVAHGRMGSKGRVAGTAVPVHEFVFDDTPIHDAVERIGRDMDVSIAIASSVSATNRVTTRMQVTGPMQALRELSLLCGCRCDSVSPLQYRLY